MNEIEKQILKNQVSIIRFLRFGFSELRVDGILSEGLEMRLQETSDMLNPTQSKEDCCEMFANTTQGVKN